MNGIRGVEDVLVEAPAIGALGTVRDQDAVRLEVRQSSALLPAGGGERLRRLAEDASHVVGRKHDGRAAPTRREQDGSVAVAVAQALEPPYGPAVRVEPILEVGNAAPAQDDAAREQRRDHVREDGSRVGCGRAGDGLSVRIHGLRLGYPSCSTDTRRMRAGWRSTQASGARNVASQPGFLFM